MQTECPHCHTLFRITDTQFDMADGMVRCGFCKQVFDASVENTFKQNKDQLDVFQDTPVPSPYQQSLDASDDIDDDTLFMGEQNAIVPDELRMEQTARSHSVLATVFWSLSILLLIASLVVEYTWFNKQDLLPGLLKDPTLKPLALKLCEYTDCAELEMRDPSRIEMISRNVYTHPNEKQALMVTTTMVNHADFAQPHPDVQIDFSNVRGELIASRRFTPPEYLQIDDDLLHPLQPGTPVTFGLEIQDPGKEAITYEFSFH